MIFNAVDCIDHAFEYALVVEVINLEPRFNAAVLKAVVQRIAVAT